VRGRGADNPAGVPLKSNRDGAIAVTQWTSDQKFCRTKTISQLRDNRTLLDCQCVSTALASAYQREGRDIGNEPDIWYATASMSVEYLRPNPIDSTVQLRAQVVATEDRATSVECVLGADGKDRSRPTVRGVRGPDD
jgi:hypothetical protein